MSYMGIYDKILNTAYSNQPDWMRTEASDTLFKAYDNLWKPVLQDIYPRTAAPGPENSGEPASVNTPFYLPNVADIQTMAGYYDFYEMPPPRGMAMDREKLQARLSKEWGPTYNPLEFKQDWRVGFLDRRNQLLSANAVKSISRLIEYELCAVSRGDENTLNRFGNQYAKTISRLKTFDALETTGIEADYLGGKAWDDADANPMDDIVTINLYLNEMASQELKMAFIGANTAAGLEKNTAVYELVKYHYDATRQPIAASIKGVTLQKVIGQTYKDAAISSTRVGYPGKGDVRFDNWTNRRKYKMMVSDDSGTGREWGLFVTGPVGNVFTAKTHPKHMNTNIPYVHEWKDPRTEWMFSELQLGFAPHVYDFAQMIVVQRLAEAKV